MEPKSSSSVSVSPDPNLSPHMRHFQIAYAADLTRETAKALRLTHPVSVTAQILLQRYYSISPLSNNCVVWVAGACVLLAAKTADTSRSLRHIASVLHDRLFDREELKNTNASRKKSRHRVLDFFGAEGYPWKVGLLGAERAVLCVLGFRITVDVPHKFILVYVNSLRENAKAASWASLQQHSTFRTLLQASWNIANDLLLSSACVSEAADVIACACIYHACTKLNITLPEGWYTIFGTTLTQCHAIGREVETVYKLGSLRGAFVDFSLTTVFQKYHPAGSVALETDGPS